MKFYRLQLGTGEEVGYVYPQLNDIDDTYDRRAKNAQRYLDYEKFPDFEPVFAKLYFNIYAKITDFISEAGFFGGKGLIVNQKVKNLLNDFSLPPHHYYPIELLKENKPIISQYYWLQILVITELVDLENSELYVTKSGGRFIKTIQISNENELYETVKGFNNIEYIAFKNLFLSQKYNTLNFDLFYLVHFYSDFIVSDTLRQALEKEKITGLSEFKELNIFT